MHDDKPKSSDGPARLKGRAVAAWDGMDRFERASAATFAFLALAIAILVLIWDWNWFKGPLESAASAKAGRPVHIDGDLEVHPFSFKPWAVINGVRVTNPDWAGPQDMLRLAAAKVQIELLPLFHGRVILPLLELDQPNLDLRARKDGVNNWTFGKKEPGKAAKLPPIRHFVIRDGHLELHDAKRPTTFVGQVSTDETDTGGAGAFHLNGQGALNRAPFTARVEGGALLNIDPRHPYPFEARISAGATHVYARGDVPRPFDLNSLNTVVTVEGPDLNDLYYLTGLTLPNTPSYKVSGHLVRDGKVYRFTGGQGRIGGSDIHGEATVDVSGKKPYLKANAASNHLNFADLGTLFGGAPANAATASPGQKAVAGAMRASGRLLPDSTLQVDRLRSMDADVRYKAASVNAPNFMPLRAVSLGVHLKDGVLDIDPLALSLPRGDITGTARIDATKATPFSRIDVRLAGARLQDLVPKVGGAIPIEGVLQGRARLAGPGDSVHKAAANADGQVTLVLPGGVMRQAFAELLGINVTKGLFLLLSKDPKETPVRCAVADFQVTNGVLRARRIVFDTGVVIAEGGGVIDMHDESLNLRIAGKPKELRIIRAMAPITLKGTLLSPKPGIEGGKLAVQAGVAGVLASALSPLAAILPFVDPGLAKNADCAGLMAQAKAEGAPVKATAAAPAKKK